MKQGRNLTKDLAALAVEERRRLGAPPTVERLLAFRDGLLEAQEEEEIRQHLSVDPALASQYLEIRQETQPVHGSEGDPVSQSTVDSAWLGLSSRLHQEMGEVEKSTVRKHTFPLWLAAAILLVTLGFVWFRGMGNLASGSQIMYQQVAFSTRQFRGSEVVLAPASPGLEFTFDDALFGPAEIFEGRLVKADQDSVIVRVEVSRLEPALRVDAGRLEEGKTYRLILRPRGGQAEAEMVMTFRIAVHN
jgi:hypothetical protein